MTTRGFQIYALTLTLAGIAALCGVIAWRTGGALFYTLDDPYIHLALAEEILRGNYGINPGEVASPSSSMLYALALAPLLALGLGTLSPLVLSVAGQGVAIWLLAGALAPPLALRRAVALVAGPLLALAINAMGLPLTGMEHPLHVAVSVAILLGLARAATGPAPGWLLVAILLAPALRFEGYAQALAAVAALSFLDHRRMALLALAGLVALSLAYGLAMQALGLPLLPSSVMVKSAASAAALGADGRSALIAVIVNAIRGAQTPQGALMILAGLVLLALVVWRPDRVSRAVVWPLLAALAAHFLVGRFGWFARYEVYAVALTLTGLGLIVPRHLPGAVLLLPLAAYGWTYLPTLQQTPAAALSVYQQQYQMHRFATAFFPHPVAVNDIGWVAYDNEGPVLDLWGLGSEEARQLTAAQGRTVGTLRQLSDGRADYAMVYDIAFEGAIPPEWCRIATLTTSRVIAASDSVSFYLIDRDLEAAMRDALTAFAPTLPAGAALSVHSCQ
ncbi:hypothetical protein C4N9_03570 [Pararhodobacter marinus]|uniref:Glycosyltransferase RgtA/B/C/D-like domain-containing protein n=1 Tax=Pararhodobacter marinus TaxID=2184063 RepID=A0A2U2CG19_9RHOB|nr:hypothetical protein [Pararhodobacter marinus]PWE30847.1 hypothetical protein C4N9_03570 [Pararhodobacter marinus]